MKKTILLIASLFFCITPTNASFEVKNWEQFGLGATCATAGLIGAGLTIKLLKKLFSRSN